MSVMRYKDSLALVPDQHLLHRQLRNNGPDAATLAQIENYMSAAADDFYQRKYSDFTSNYQRAALIICSYLDPQFTPVWTGQFLSIPKDVRLFDSLLSVGAQYLNILPIASPQTSVAGHRWPSTPPSRVSAQPTRPASAAPASSSQLPSSAPPADIQAAANLRALGMTALAGNLENAATKSDANTAAIFKTAIGGKLPTTAALAETTPSAAGLAI